MRVLRFPTHIMLFASHCHCDAISVADGNATACSSKYFAEGQGTRFKVNSNLCRNHEHIMRLQNFPAALAQFPVPDVPVNQQLWRCWFWVAQERLACIWCSSFWPGGSRWKPSFVHLKSCQWMWPGTPDSPWSLRRSWTWLMKPLWSTWQVVPLWSAASDMKETIKACAAKRRNSWCLMCFEESAALLQKRSRLWRSFSWALASTPNRTVQRMWGSATAADSEHFCVCSLVAYPLTMTTWELRNFFGRSWWTRASSGVECVQNFW